MLNKFTGLCETIRPEFRIRVFCWIRIKIFSKIRIRIYKHPDLDTKTGLQAFAKQLDQSFVSGYLLDPGQIFFRGFESGFIAIIGI